MFVLDDCHVACEVTSAVDPLERVAVAVNWDFDPTIGAVPLTVMDLTAGLDGVDAESPHAHSVVSRLTIAVRLSAPIYLMIACITAFSNSGRMSRTGVWIIMTAMRSSF